MFPTFIELTYSKCALQNAQSMQFTNPSNLGATSPPISLTLKQVLYLSSWRFEKEAIEKKITKLLKCY